MFLDNIQKGFFKKLEEYLAISLSKSKYIVSRGTQKISNFKQTSVSLFKKLINGR